MASNPSIKRQRTEDNLISARLRQDTAETWAGALLDTLVSPYTSLVAEGSISTRKNNTGANSHDVVDAASSALFRLALQVKCAPVHERARLLATLKTDITAAIDTLESLAPASAVEGASVASATCAEAVPAATGCPSKAEPAAEPGNDVLAGGAGSDTEDDAAHAADADVLAGQDAEVRVHPEDLNNTIARNVMASEQETKTKVIEAELELGSPMPMYVRFVGCHTPLSMHRVAALCSPNFFRACGAAAQALSPLRLDTWAAAAGAGAAVPAAPAAAPPQRPQGVGPDVVAIFVKVMESAAPTALTLRQARRVFHLIHTCSADELAVPFAQYISPLMADLTPWQVVWLIAQVLDYVPSSVRSRLVIKHLISEDLKHRPILPLGAKPAPPPTPTPGPGVPRATKLSSFAPAAIPSGLPTAAASSPVTPAQALLHTAPQGLLYAPAASATSNTHLRTPAHLAATNGAAPPALDDVDALIIFVTDAFTKNSGSTQHAARSSGVVEHGGQKYLDIVECCTIPRMPAWLKIACVAAACMHVQEWKPMPLKYVLAAVDAVSGSREHGIEWGPLLRRMLVRLAHGPLHAARVQIACRVLHRLSQREARAKAIRSVQ